MPRAPLLLVVACSHAAATEPAEPELCGISTPPVPQARSVPPPATSPAPPTVASPAAPRDDRRLVIGEVTQRVEECSGMGGEHYVIRLADGSGRIVHAGGHGARLGLIPDGMPVRDTQFVVVELEPAGAHPTSSELMINRGWCLDAMPEKVDGYAGRITRGGDLARARRMLGELEARGLPPRSSERRQTQLILDIKPCMQAICDPL